jgi:hypothetical protein
MAVVVEDTRAAEEATRVAEEATRVAEEATEVEGATRVAVEATRVAVEATEVAEEEALSVEEDVEEVAMVDAPRSSPTPKAFTEMSALILVLSKIFSSKNINRRRV